MAAGAEALRSDLARLLESAPADAAQTELAKGDLLHVLDELNRATGGSGTAAASPTRASLGAGRPPQPIFRETLDILRVAPEPLSIKGILEALQARGFVVIRHGVRKALRKAMEPTKH
jgi:hypothetical protein